MLNRSAFENSRPDGFGVLEVVENEGDGARRFVPLKLTMLKGEINGPVAALTLEATYGFSREQCDQVLETIYRFPLPGDAAVMGVQVRFGDADIIAELKERHQAEADYEEARSLGQQAALVTRETPDVFTLQVAGVKPDKEVRVQVTYVQVAPAEGAGWSLRIPLTTAPRYTRSDEAGSRQAQGQPLALLRDPGHRFGLDLQIAGSGKVACRTHALDVQEDKAHLRIRLREGEVVPDRDCVLTWRPEQFADRPALSAAIHLERSDDQVYFLALVAPPSEAENKPKVAREAILLVDHSGSMDGAKWEAADWAVEKFLLDLNERDTFALGLFHNTTRWFQNKPLAATPGAVEKAIQFLKQHRDSGGTELGVALEQALDLPRTSDERARHVLIVTDVEVSDAARIMHLAASEAKRERRRRISVLCIDAAPNSFLATELAEVGGGVARFLTSSPEEEDITTALDEVLADWAAPAAHNLRLQVDAPGLEAAGRDVIPMDGKGTSAAIDLGDLPAGRPVWVVGRCAARGVEEINFTLNAGKNEKMAGCRVRLGGDDHERPALKAIFGARLILALEYLMNGYYEDKELNENLERLGYDPTAVRKAGVNGGKKLYAENEMKSTRESLRPLLVGESLRYGLASAEAAFVAVRKEAGKLVEGTVAVANALPHGWSGGFKSRGYAGAMPASPAAYYSMAPAAAMPAQSGGATLREASPNFLKKISSHFTRSSASQAAQDAAPASYPSPTPLVQGSGGSPWFAQGAATGQEVFSGVPIFKSGEALLLEDAGTGASIELPAAGVISSVEVRYSNGEGGAVDSGLTLLFFVDDLSSPRARVKLADLTRANGKRPLNILRRAGQMLRIVLSDPNGAWAGGAPALEVKLLCQ